MRKIAGAIIPFVNGIHPDSATTTLPNGYVSAYDILEHEVLKSPNIIFPDLSLIDHVQRGDHCNDQFFRNLKFVSKSRLIIYDGVICGLRHLLTVEIYIFG